MATVKTTKKSKAAVEPKMESKEVETTSGTFDSKKMFSIKHPLITEKAYRLSSDGKYVFMVDSQTNKAEVKKAVKILYKVDPVSVNIINSRGKNTHFGSKFTKGKEYKKAIVTLKKGQKIDIMPS